MARLPRLPSALFPHSWSAHGDVQSVPVPYAPSASFVPAVQSPLRRQRWTSCGVISVERREQRLGKNPVLYATAHMPSLRSPSSDSVSINAGDRPVTRGKNGTQFPQPRAAWHDVQ